MSKYVSAIIVAAGSSVRMGTDGSKQFIPLLGKPAILHTLTAFQNSENIDEIIIVCREQDSSKIKELAEENIFKFSVSEPCDYLCAYEASGYPMVSHSEVYKEHYHPSYRIVTENLFNTYFKEEE